jgi:flavin-dependent dehydrogenase
VQQHRPSGIDRRQSSSVCGVYERVIELDVLVVGVGPAGLAFVRALAGAGLSVALVERHPVTLPTRLTTAGASRTTSLAAAGGAHVGAAQGM